MILVCIVAKSEYIKVQALIKTPNKSDISLDPYTYIYCDGILDPDINIHPDTTLKPDMCKCNNIFEHV